MSLTSPNRPLSDDELRVLAADHNNAPCIAICSTSSGDEVCFGCGRSFDELCRWWTMGADERFAVWKRIETADTVRNRRRRGGG